MHNLEELQSFLNHKQKNVPFLFLILQLLSSVYNKEFRHPEQLKTETYKGEGATLRAS